ncbi:MAG: hypothetical protein HYX80_10275 [Chloroflexi bacterium]|nr:hypothetical protein [Chloroflexota bacterium]
MWKTGLWWAALITGLLGVALVILPLAGAWRFLEPGDRFLALGLGLLSFVCVAVGWKWPLIAGALLIAEVLLLWGWGAVQVIIIGNRTGHFEPIVLLSAVLLYLPLLVSGVLFLLWWKRSTVMATR